MVPWINAVAGTWKVPKPVFLLSVQQDDETKVAKFSADWGAKVAICNFQGNTYEHMKVWCRTCQTQEYSTFCVPMMQHILLIASCRASGDPINRYTTCCRAVEGFGYPSYSSKIARHWALSALLECADTQHSLNMLINLHHQNTLHICDVCEQVFIIYITIFDRNPLLVSKISRLTAKTNLPQPVLAWHPDRWPCKICDELHMDILDGVHCATTSGPSVLFCMQHASAMH